MFINNENISVAIKAICNAYKALPDNGFRLHVEDQAPDEIQCAGQIEPEPKVVSTTQEISEEDLPESVKKALGLGAVGIADRLMGLTVPKEILVGWDGEIYDQLYLFYKPLIKEAHNIDELEKLVKEYVRHEWRHGCQFNWLRAHGIDVIGALMQENSTVYGSGPLEADAHKFQWGEVDELDVAMASFLA